MSRFFIGTTAVLCALGAGSVFAAGIERSSPTTRALFEPGTYLEFSGRLVSPDQTGSGTGLAPSTNTGNLYENFTNLSVAYKADINEKLSFAFIADDPWGVDVDYPDMGALSLYSGTTAKLDSFGLTGILAYDVRPNIKVYGGIRAQTMEATAAIPFVGGYTIDTDLDIGFGYMVGAAFSKPEIALRVALTYYSEIDHTLDSVEFGALSSTVDITTPESVSLEFQTGIAEGTLVFGSIRWVNWSDFAITPPNYPLGILVDYASDWTNYSIGIGRRFNDTWSGAILASYEPASDTILTTLGPVDGKKSLGAALTYTVGNAKITGGLSYVWLGDATNVVGTSFSGGDAIVAGFRVAMQL